MANVCSDGVPLAVLCSFERKGCGSRLGQQELAMACVCVRPAVSGGGPSVAGAHGRQAGSEVWQWQGVVAVAVACNQQQHAHLHMHL